MINSFINDPQIRASGNVTIFAYSISCIGQASQGKIWVAFENLVHLGEQKIQRNV